jgi:Transglutaminase-like superfamily
VTKTSIISVANWNRVADKNAKENAGKVKGERMVMQFETLRHLPNRDRRLVLKTMWMLWRVQLSLWFSPALALETYHRIVVNRSSSQHAPVYQILWAIHTASRFIPKATSLTEALAAKALLARYGYDSKLHVGVLKAGTALEAHAWLTQSGNILLGELEDLTGYRPLSTIKGQKNKLVWRSVRQS